MVKKVDDAGKFNFTVLVFNTSLGSAERLLGEVIMKLNT